MDLFHVQRYFGEGEDRETNSETQKKIEDARLKELKKKIRKRKKEKRTVCEAKEESSSKAEKGDSKCKKKVKLKTGDDVSDQKGRTSLVIPVTISDSGSGTSENNIRKSNLKHKLRESEPDHEIKNAVESYKPAEFGDLLESMKKSTESDTKVHTSLSRSKTKQIHINNKTESNKDVEKESSQSILQGTNGKERSEIDQDQYFTVLGHTHKKQKGKSEVKITLPSWLAEPTLINANINSGKVPVSRVAGLSSAMMTKLAEQDIEYLFPVQSTVIPFILSQMQPASSLGKMGFTPSDICVSAPTGSGKTLAYVLPILQTLSRCTVRRLQALMILPTKDLASQIKKVVDKFAGGMNIRTGLASGIKSFQSEQEHLITNG